LREETGYSAKKFSKLFEFYPTPGYSTEKIYIYQAENLEFVGRDLEEGEYIEVVPKSKAELKELFQAGKIKDSKTLIAVMYYLGDF
jgi:ADP-ribose pyrophosphatase